MEIPGWARFYRYLVRVARLRSRRFALTFGAGTLIVVLLQFPFFEQSALGELDRTMLDTAFDLRRDLVRAEADPVLFIDIDDETVSQGLSPGVWPRAPEPRTRRDLVAALLRYVLSAPPEVRPKAVILDVDLATPQPDPSAEALKAVLADWARTPAAPRLILAREAFAPSAFGSAGERLFADKDAQDLVLPSTDYDSIVAGARNVQWAEVKVLADQNGVARDLVAFECVRGPGESRGRPLFHAALLAFEATSPVEGRRLMREWSQEASACAGRRDERGRAPREPINYHFSLEFGDEAERVWPDLPKGWNPRCAGDRAIFRRLSAGDVAAAGADASHDILCGRLVVIGGTNQVSADYRQTPTDEMPGSVILANAARGLQMAGGGLRRFPLTSQLLLMLVVCAAFSASFTITRRIRRKYRRYLRITEKPSLAVRAQLVALNPVVLNAALAFAAHALGIVMLLVTLDFGLWGFVSAPALAASLSETMQEFAENER